MAELRAAAPTLAMARFFHDKNGHYSKAKDRGD